MKIHNSKFRHRARNKAFKYIILLVFSFIFGYVFYSLESAIFSADLFFFPRTFPTLSFTNFHLFLISLGIFFIGKLRTEKIHKQASWIFYTYFSLALSPLFSALFFIALNDAFINHHSYKSLSISLAYRTVLALIFLCIYCVVPPRKVDVPKDFAADSIGLQGDTDKFNFTPSAKHVSEGLLQLDDYVSVVALHGGLGEGKSSYARMIIESIAPIKILYTYISLTETNEANDFSKLFNERWLNTLSERYPKINLSSGLPVMNSILREYSNGFVAEVIGFISKFNPCILKTFKKVADKNSSSEDPFVSNEIAVMFCGIPEIKEDLWIIMIDEIERAKFDEIYRLIEIIERFKIEGRPGLPIKIMFLLCFSQNELKRMISLYTNHDLSADLIDQFFFRDPKSFTHNIFLPPIDLGKKQKFVNDEIKTFSDRHSITLPPLNDPEY